MEPQLRGFGIAHCLMQLAVIPHKTLRLSQILFSDPGCYLRLLYFHSEAPHGEPQQTMTRMCRGFIGVRAVGLSCACACVLCVFFLERRRRDVRGAFVPGKLQAYLDAQYAPLSDVIQACVVRHSDQLVRARHPSFVHNHRALSVRCTTAWFRREEGYPHLSSRKTLGRRTLIVGYAHTLQCTHRTVRLFVRVTSFAETQLDSSCFTSCVGYGV